MARSAGAARAAGAWMERITADYLAEHVDDRIQKAPKWGSVDRGDVTGLRHMGGRVVIQCKERGGQAFIGSWLAQVEVQRGNDDALAGVVVGKRHGSRKPADQVVLMTLRDFVALMTGTRPGEDMTGANNGGTEVEE